MTFLERFDEVLAGKTKGPWQALNPLMLDDEAERADKDFIAFVGTHAELIRDALRAAKDLSDRHDWSPHFEQSCTCDPHALFRHAFRRLDEAVK